MHGQQNIKIWSKLFYYFKTS